MIKSAFFLGCWYASGIQGQELPYEELKSRFIFQFTRNIIWPGEEDIKTFRIGMYGDDTETYNLLKQQKGSKIKNVPFEVIQIQNINRLENVHLLYVAKSSVDETRRLAEAVAKKNILLVTEESKDVKYIMLNIFRTPDESVSFQVNKNNILIEGLTIDPDLLLLGGTEVDVRELYQEVKLSLEKYAVQLNEQQSIINDLGNEIKSQQQALAEKQNENKVLEQSSQVLREEIAQIRNEVSEKESALSKINSTLNQYRKTSSDLETKMTLQREEIGQQEKRIEAQDSLIIQGKNELSRLALESNKKQFVIDEQNESLDAKEKIILYQKILIYSSIAVIIIIIWMLILLLVAFQKRKKLTEQLRVSNLELEKANEIKNKLFAILGHDIRGPLNSLSIFSHMLTDSFDIMSREEIQGLAKEVNKSMGKLFALLHDLLTWARSKNENIDFKPETFSINEIIQENKELLSAQAASKEIVIYPSENMDIFVRANKTSINTVVRNLISNAIKFTPNGGAIRINATKNDLEATVSIEDSGVGMTKEVCQKLFNQDMKYSTLGTSGEIGTGFGLILCKEFVGKNNGRIWAESEVGKGTVLYFTIPLSNAS